MSSLKKSQTVLWQLSFEHPMLPKVLKVQFYEPDQLAYKKMWKGGDTESGFP